MRSLAGESRSGSETVGDAASALDRSITARTDHALDELSELDREDMLGTAAPLLPAPAPSSGRTSRFTTWTRRYVAATVLADVAVGLVAVLVATHVLEALDRPFWPVSIALLAGAVAWPVAIASAHGYERRKVGVGGDEMRAVLRAAIVLVVLTALPAGLFDLRSFLALAVFTALPAMLGSIGVRYVGRKILHRRQRSGLSVRRVVVVGSLWSTADLVGVLGHATHNGMQVVGVCVPAAEAARAAELGLTVLGDLDHVPAVIREFGCDAVAVTGGEATRHNYLRELAWSLEGERVELLVHPGLVEVAGPRMHIRPYVGLPLLHIDQPHFAGWRRVFKRLVDIVLTGVGLLLISPVLLAIAVAVKLEDGGPVLFRQTRVGLDGRTFTMLKFRSMAVDAEQRLAALLEQNEGAGPLFKMVDDPRVTRVGRFLRKFSLDELPQLFNVLAGSMSLVGPRPPLQSEVDAYARDARRRLLVTPGLTGLWQVSGRSLLSWEETVRLDLRYVENWSLTLDLLILWKTVFAVLARRGAY